MENDKQNDIDSQSGQQKPQIRWTFMAIIAAVILIFGIGSIIVYYCLKTPHEVNAEERAYMLAASNIGLDLTKSAQGFQIACQLNDYNAISALQRELENLARNCHDLETPRRFKKHKHLLDLAVINYYEASKNLAIHMAERDSDAMIQDAKLIQLGTDYLSKSQTEYEIAAGYNKRSKSNDLWPDELR